MTTPVRFGYNNRVISAVLAASPEPTTALDNLKSELPSRRTVWNGLTTGSTVTISGEVDSAVYSQFMCLPDAHKIGDAEVKLELYLDGSADLLGMPFTPFPKDTPADYIPLGEGGFAAGITAYGARFDYNTLLPSTFVHWFGGAFEWDSFSLTIQQAGDDPLDEVDMRMLFLGNYYEMQTGMTFPHDITYMTPPQLAQTSSGLWVPLVEQRQSRTMTVPLPYSTLQDSNALRELERFLQNRAFLISAFPEDSDPAYSNYYTMLGRFPSEVNHSARFINYHDTSLTVVEA